MAKLNAGNAGSGRTPRALPCMTPSQFRAYLLARETLRRLRHAASVASPAATETRP